jgi:hypothetical protein
MNSVVPATSSLLSRFPAWIHGGLLLTRPALGGGATPMLPKNGSSGTTIPGAKADVIVCASIGMIFVVCPGPQFCRRNPLQPLSYGIAS